MNLITIVTNLALQGKYIFLFFIYLIEGPISGFISAMIASTGQLNIYIIAILLISGEIGADLFYYFLGDKIGSSGINSKLIKYEKSGILNKIKNALEKHPLRTLAIAKTVGVIAPGTIILLGKYRPMKPLKFIFWTSVICLSKDLFVLFLGYGLGISLESFLSAYDIYKLVGIILSLILIVYLLFKDNIERFTIKSLEKFK